MPAPLTRRQFLQMSAATVSGAAVMAGLQSVRYVFCYPDTGDIVIAGPAEGWARDTRGVHRGIVSGRSRLVMSS